MQKNKQADKPIMAKKPMPYKKANSNSLKKNKTRYNKNKAKNTNQPNTEKQTGNTQIVTKKPAWETEKKEREPFDKSRSNTQRKNTPKKTAATSNNQKKKRQSDIKTSKKPEVKKMTPINVKGIFDFSEKELQEDTALQVISRRENDLIKYTNFEAYLQDKKNNTENK